MRILWLSAEPGAAKHLHSDNHSQIMTDVSLSVSDSGSAEAVSELWTNLNYASLSHVDVDVGRDQPPTTLGSGGDLECSYVSSSTSYVSIFPDPICGSGVSAASYGHVVAERARIENILPT